MALESAKNFLSGNILKIFSVLCLSGFFVVVLDSDLRSNIRSVLRPQYRIVLAVASADLKGVGLPMQILKVKTHDGIFLEVYSNKSESTGIGQELLASVQLPDKKDGYFTFNGQVTNLAIDDIDSDNQPEILATSFDNDLVAHLNVYRYVPGRKELELVRLN